MNRSARVAMRGRGIGRAVAALWLLALLPVAAHAASVTYEHDAQGRLIKAIYNDGTVVDYAYDANGDRISSQLRVVQDTIPPSAPSAPGFSAITAVSATASWSAATDNIGVAGYDYQLDAGGWRSLGNVLSVNLTGLASSTLYTLQVRARDALGNPGPASAGSFTTLPPPDTTAPSVPTGLSASAPTSNSVNLSWAASSDNVGVSGYRIFRQGAQLATRTTTSYTDSTVSGSSSYAYTVSAWDAAGNVSAPSGAVNVTTPDTIAPSTPSGLAASAASPTRVNLAWSASSDAGGSGLAGYRVYRNGAQLATSAATSYADIAAAGSTTYSYTVAAYDNAGNASAPSSAASVTTPPALNATVSATSWSWFSQQGQPVRVSPNVVVTASGGMGGYSYAWQRVSGDTQTSVVSPSSSSTKWSRTVPNYFVDYRSVWRCLVTDSAGNTAYTPNVTVNFRKENYQ